MKAKLKPIIIIVLILFMISIFFICNKLKKTENVNNQENQAIAELKNETGVTGNEEIYEIVNESNNTPILSVKEDIKFKVAVAAIFKGEKPKLEEVDKIISTNNLYKNGIYVSENSREEFLRIITKNTKNKYRINNEGYLEYEKTESENDNDKQIIEMIDSNKLYIINISFECYTIDDVSGEIVDYPFEIMDPYQICQSYKSSDKIVITITTNSKKKVNDEDIFNELLSYK